MRKKLLSILALLLMAVTGAQADNLTITIGDMLENEDDHAWGYQLYSGDVSIAEGTYVQFNLASWHSQTLTIYMNGESVWTGSGNQYVDDIYHFTAGKNCKIKGGYSNMFNWDNNPNVRITQDASVAVTGNSDGAATPSYWATYYNGTQSYMADANTTVYKAAMNGTSSLTLTEVADIPAGKAVILKSSSATITLMPAASTTADLSDNVLLGGTTVTAGNEPYTLASKNGVLGFYKFTGTLDGNKAHLELPASTSRSFIGFGDEETTSISEELRVKSEEFATATWYTLDGRKLIEMPTKAGLYIMNGKKVVIK